MAAHRFWRVLITANDGGTWAGLSYLEFHAVHGGPSVVGGGTVLYSSQFDGDTPRWGAHNAYSPAAGGWVGTTGAPQHIGYDWGAGNAVSVVEVLIRGFESSSRNGYAPRALSVQFSDDGVAWATAESFTNLATWGNDEVRSFYLVPPDWSALPRRVTVDGLYVIDATPRRRVAVDGVYVIHGPNQRRVTVDGVYVVAPEAPPLAPTVTAPAVLTPGAAEAFPRGTTEVALSWSPSTETSSPTTPIRYDAQWRAAGAGTWLPLFTGLGADDVLEYAWTGLTGGGREVRVGGYREGEPPAQIAWSDVRAFSIDVNHPPATPAIIMPAEGEVVTGALVVSFDPVLDPDGDEVTYSARMRKTPSGGWITLADEEPHHTLYYDLTTLAVEGQYEIELWATDAEGLASAKAVRTFTTDPSAAGALVFTAPEGGSEHNESVPLQWDPAAGAESYTLRYQKPGESTWNTITSSLPGSATNYLWDTSNTTTFPEGEYTVEGWAVKDGVAGEAGYLVVQISRARGPTKPTIKVLSVDFQTASLSGSAYQHPDGVAHKATQFDVFYPKMDEAVEGGDSIDSPTFPAPTITWSPIGLPSNALLGARVRYQDTNNKWSRWSTPAFFFADDTRGYSWRPAWEVIRSDWYQPTAISDGKPYGVLWGFPHSNGCKYSSHPRLFDSCPTYEPAGMLRVTDGTFGSARVSGYGLIHGAGGPWWAWKWLTSDFNKIGVMLGDGMDMYGTSNATGAAMWLDCGALASLNHLGGACTSPPSGWRVGVSIPNSANVYIRVRYKDKYGNRTSKSAYRYGIGYMVAQRYEAKSPPDLARYPWCLDWSTGESWPWYQMELKVQRYLSSPTGAKSVVYARGRGPGLSPPDVLEDGGDVDNPDHYWHLRVEVPGVVLECGYPGYVQHDIGGLWGRAQREFTGLSIVRFPDLGTSSAPDVVPPPDPREPEPDVPCTAPQPEAAPEAAALFPAPPDWEEGVRESVTYPTDVIAGQDDSEQRIALRQHPRRGLRYTAVCLDAEEVAYLEALLWERQAMRWAVPLWTEGVPLAAPLPAGSLLIPGTAFDPSERRFGGRRAFALWEGVQSCELLAGEYVPSTLDTETGEVLNPGGIVLTAPTTRAWGEWAVLLPVEMGYLEMGQRVERPATTALELPVEFTLDADGAS